MEILKVVPSLENLARDAAFNAIHQDLELCYGHGPSGNRFYLRSPECEIIRDRVRSKLDLTVWGTVSYQARMDFVESYYKCLKNLGAESNIVVDPWLFLDTVLEENFKELQIHAALPGKEASYQLMQIIADRSPLLTKLTIDFSLMKRADDSRESEKKFDTVIRSLALLHHLVDLHLMGLTNREELIMHSLIGEVGTSLSSLRVSDSLKHEDYLGRNDKFILALIMGRFAEFFSSEDRPSWCEIDQLERIDVPAEFRTKICSSLRVLQFGFHGYCSPQAAAFVLRNIPLLQKWDYLINLADGIEMLHRSQQENNSFQGQLSLTRVNRVNVKSRKQLRAVGDLCPSLKQVEFWDWFDDQVEDDDLVSSAELAIILSEWPKPTSIVLFEVSHVYVQAILKVFGPELKHLKIDSYFENGLKLVKVAHFAMCSRLESLTIYNFRMKETEDVSALDSTTFLPHLKSFTSDGCLGRFSPYFEEKSTLVHLDVNCSHMVMGRNCRLSLEKFQKQHPASWSQLETLSIRQFASLRSGLVVLDFLPRLRWLKKVELPLRILSDPVLLYESVKNELGKRMPPGVISFQDFEGYENDCILNI